MRVTMMYIMSEKSYAQAVRGALARGTNFCSKVSDHNLRAYGWLK